MKKLFQLLGIEQTKGDVGVEIECEGENMEEINTKFWRCEDDGSLRGEYPNGRCEYIFKNPTAIKDVPVALTQLADHLSDAELAFSHRCSVHVHLNAQELTITQLMNLVYTYLILEEPLMTFCGKKRKGNNFCLRLSDAEGMLQLINNMFIHGEECFQYFERDMYRYSAMNLEALKKYGSVEFRGMEGNLDIERLSSWCNVLVALRTYAASVQSPEHIYEEYANAGPLAFMDRVFGEHSVLLYYPKAVRDIQRGFSLSLDLPFIYKANKENHKVPEWDGELSINDVVDYNSAVEIIAAGGQVKEKAYPHYIVTQLPKRAIKGQLVIVKKAPKKKPLKIDMANFIAAPALPALNFNIEEINLDDENHPENW